MKIIKMINNDLTYLEGENIILRKALLSDLSSIYENVWSDKAIAQNMFWEVSNSMDEAKDKLNRTIDFQKDKYLYFIALKKTNEAIGYCGIKQEDESTYSEAGLAIARKYQNKGYGKEMLSLLLDLAFNKLNIPIFAYYCMYDNIVSKKLALHFNFHYHSSEKEIRKYDEKEFLIDKYILTKEEYMKSIKK